MFEISFIISIAAVATLYSFMVLGLNVSWGFNKILNFGLVGFFAIGAFTTSVLTGPTPPPGTEHIFGFGLPIPIGIIAGSILAGLAAALLGFAALRVKGPYLAMTSFAFANLILIVSEQEAWLTGGYYGINKVPQIFGGDIPFMSYNLFYLILAITLLLLTMYTLDKLCAWSPFGRLLRGIGDSDKAASMLGKNIFRVRTVSFALSGLICGFGGALFAHYFGFVVSTQFYAFITWTAWVALLVGGAGNNRAALIGSAIIFFGLMQLVRLAPVSTSNPTLFTSARSLAMGIILMAVMRTKPEGLFKEIV